jgi:hypothetical protein
MRTDPKPVEDIACANGQRSIGTGYPNRPEWSNGFQVQRRMKRIGLKQSVLLVGSLLYLDREIIVSQPEARQRSRLKRHSRRSARPLSMGRVRPSAISRSSSDRSAAPRPPAEKSRSICSSQEFQSRSLSQLARAVCCSGGSCSIASLMESKVIP